MSAPTTGSHQTNSVEQPQHVQNAYNANERYLSPYMDPWTTYLLKCDETPPYPSNTDLSSYLERKMVFLQTEKGKALLLHGTEVLNMVYGLPDPLGTAMKMQENLTSYQLNLLRCAAKVGDKDFLLSLYTCHNWTRSVWKDIEMEYRRRVFLSNKPWGAPYWDDFRINNTGKWGTGKWEAIKKEFTYIYDVLVWIITGIDVVLPAEPLIKQVSNSNGPLPNDPTRIPMEQCGAEALANHDAAEQSGTYANTIWPNVLEYGQMEL